MIAYYYFVYALSRVSRVHLELGTDYAYWRVGLFITIVQGIIVFVCSSWIDTNGMDRLLSDASLWPYCLAGALALWLGAINDRLILLGYGRYKQEIESWTSRKRKICDAMVVAFVIAVSLLFAITLKKLKAVHDNKIHQHVMVDAYESESFLVAVILKDDVLLSAGASLSETAQAIASWKPLMMGSDECEPTGQP